MLWVLIMFQLFLLKNGSKTHFWYMDNDKAINILGNAALTEESVKNFNPT